MTRIEENDPPSVVWERIRSENWDRWRTKEEFIHWLTGPEKPVVDKQQVEFTPTPEPIRVQCSNGVAYMEQFDDGAWYGLFEVDSAKMVQAPYLLWSAEPEPTDETIGEVDFDRIDVRQRNKCWDVMQYFRLKMGWSAMKKWAGVVGAAWGELQQGSQDADYDVIANDSYPGTLPSFDDLLFEFIGVEFTKPRFGKEGY